jgi:hypothetical protein
MRTATNPRQSLTPTNYPDFAKQIQKHPAVFQLEQFSGFVTTFRL